MKKQNLSLDINKIHFATYLGLIDKFEYIIQESNFLNNDKIKYSKLYNLLSFDNKLLFNQYVKKCIKINTSCSLSILTYE